MADEYDYDDDMGDWMGDDGWMYVEDEFDLAVCLSPVLSSLDAPLPAPVSPVTCWVNGGIPLCRSSPTLWIAD
jgi:hypothetical protein